MNSYQQRVLDSMNDFGNKLIIGVPRSGKTYLANQLGVTDVEAIGIDLVKGKMRSVFRADKIELLLERSGIKLPLWCADMATLMRQLCVLGGVESVCNDISMPNAYIPRFCEFYKHVLEEEHIHDNIDYLFWPVLHGLLCPQLERVVIDDINMLPPVYLELAKRCARQIVGFTDTSMHPNKINVLGFALSAEVLTLPLEYK